MQHGVGRAAHGDVERHGVLERLEAGDRARQRGLVIVLVVAAGEIDDEMAGLDEQALAVGVGGHDRAVAGQREAERLGEAVHGVGGEHARAGAAGRAGVALQRLHLLVGIMLVGRRDHRVDEVDRFDLALDLDLAGLHRPARDENGGNVEPQRRHQHARRDLVAVGDADQRVGAMCVDHVFDAVGDEFARGQGIEHSVVAHGDAVIDRDGVELLGDAAGRLDLARDELAEILQMHVTRHELREGVGDGDDRLAEVAFLDPRGAPQAAGAGHVAAVSGGSRAIGGHDGGLSAKQESALFRKSAAPRKAGGHTRGGHQAPLTGFNGSSRQCSCLCLPAFTCCSCVPPRVEVSSRALGSQNCILVALLARVHVLLVRSAWLFLPASTCCSWVPPWVDIVRSFRWRPRHGNRGCTMFQDFRASMYDSS